MIRSFLAVSFLGYSNLKASFHLRNVVVVFNLGLKMRDYLVKWTLWWGIWHKVLMIRSFLAVSFLNYSNLKASFHLNNRENPLWIIKTLRRVRDSNPRSPFGAYTLSKRAPSTARPTLLWMECESSKFYLFSSKIIDNLKTYLHLISLNTKYLILWIWIYLHRDSSFLLSPFCW